MYTLSGKLIHERINGANRENYYLGSQLVAHQGAGEKKYIHPDVLGGTAATTNAAKSPERTRYAPYGSAWGHTPKNEIGYTGHKQDSDTGLVYMQARYYDPVIGRFYSNDPVGFTGEIDTFNRYSYVANNPYKYTDPNGEAKVYIWAEGPTADSENPSFAGHVSVLTEGGQGTYISKFPSKKVPWNSSAVFNTYADDVAIYGRDADKVIDIDLHSEEGADKFARGLKADPTQQWSATNNCADAVESVLNAGGLITPKGDVI